MDLKGKRVLVMGLGLHGGGLGVTRWLLRQGAQVTVTDLKKPEDLAPTLEALRGEPVEFVLGEHRESDFTNSDLVIRNPGVPRESRYLRLAREHGVPIRMELGLFFEQLPRGAAQVVGITGTKGKSTTTLMVGAILAQTSKTVVAGNLRISALELLPRIDADTWVVLEMSSFQLEEFEELRISPHIAAITNIYPDHLNRYRDMEEYTAAKANIFLFQKPADYCVLNSENPVTAFMGAQVPSRRVWFSNRRAIEGGAFLDDETIVWNYGGVLCNVLPVSEIGVPGAHNIENALAATAVAGAAGARPEAIAQALREFKGAPHRMEVVRELDGVTYVNDTTATAPMAAIAALRSLAGRGGRVVLIAGGSDKGLSYDEMGQVIKETGPSVILLEGSATGKLEAAMQAAGAGDLIIGTYGRFEEAVGRARQEAKRGDVVLLSPGAASFGMFANEFERGDKFRELVMAL